MYESNRKEFDDKFKKAMGQALTAIGLFVEGDAKLRCPVDSGNLRSSITHRVDEGEKKVTVGTNSNYAIFVEKGTGIHADEGKGRKTAWSYRATDGTFRITRGQKPQPFLTPAVEGNVRAITELVRRYLAI
jgi:HK97 gp10 family phage protein